MTDTDNTRALLAQIESLTVQRDAAEALARSNNDPAHARALADAVADRLFVEGERDAALHDLAVANDHLEAANNAHAEAEEDLVKVTADRNAAIARAEKAEAMNRVDAEMLAVTREVHRAEMEALRNPPKHEFWGAGEADCPKDIKAPNGELWAMRCKVCSGDGRSPCNGPLLVRWQERTEAAERRESELGLQVVAQAARLRLADGVAKAWAAYDRGIQRASGHMGPSPVGVFIESESLDAMYEAILSAKAAWDAVPGGVDAAYAAAERRESELGLQVVAQAARLRLADEVVDASRGICTRYMPRLIAALAAWDAVPGDVGSDPDDTPANRPARLGASYPLPPPPDTRPRYASGEVPMVGDVVTNDSGNHAPVTGLDDGEPILNGGVHYYSRDLTLVRRAASPAPDLSRAVALLRQHAYDVDVRAFLADFDAKGGV